VDGAIARRPSEVTGSSVKLRVPKKRVIWLAVVLGLLCLVMGHPAELFYGEREKTAKARSRVVYTRTVRSVVQSCVGAHSLGVTGSGDAPILVGGRFIKRFHRARSRGVIRARSEAKVLESGCVQGSFKDDQSIKVVLLADGYTARELPAAREHIATVTQMFSEQEPFRRYGGFLSICYKILESPVSGVSVVGTEANCGGVSRALCTDPTVVHAVGDVEGVKPQVYGVLFNSEEYYGASQYWDAIFALSRGARAKIGGKPASYWVAMHEFFHACCIGKDDSLVRNYTRNPTSRFDNKIQDEYPTGAFQCDGARSYNLSRTESERPWKYAPPPHGATYPLVLGQRLCAYKSTETSIMHSLRSSKANLATQAGWIRQLFSLVRTVLAIEPSSKPLRRDGVLVLKGAEKLPFPAVDWFVDGNEVARCRNRSRCTVRALRLGVGVHQIRARVGVADPVLNPDELEELTDEVESAVAVSGPVSGDGGRRPGRVLTPFSGRS
jgi:hypothetical protein